MHVSNNPFLSKVIERVVCNQLDSYLQANSLYPPRQSAYRKHFSTETALLKVHNDVTMALDQHQEVILVMLDLSAAFDTIDHSILLQRLEHQFGICCTALKWFASWPNSDSCYRIWTLRSSGSWVWCSAGISYWCIFLLTLLSPDRWYHWFARSWIHVILRWLKYIHHFQKLI